jgi:hypothetical protein
VREPLPSVEEEWELESLESLGGYLFTADPEAPPVTLTEPLAVYADRFRVSVPPGELPEGAYYLIGGPGQPGFEVIQVGADERLQRPQAPAVGDEVLIRRCMCKTFGFSHPAGTAVTAVTVRFVENWAAEEQPPNEPLRVDEIGGRLEHLERESGD